MSKRLILILCSLFLVFFFFISLNISGKITSNEKINLLAEIKTSTDDTYQLFYDTGKGYNESDSIPYFVSGSSEFQQIKFMLPVADIVNLRLDFGSKISEIQIKAIYLQNARNKTNITDEFDLKHDIGSYSTNNGLITFTSIGTDPFINTKDISKSFYSLKNKSSIYILNIVISLFFTIVFFFLLKTNSIHIANLINFLKNNLQSTILIVTFILLIFIPLFSNILPKKQLVSNNENRVLASKPELTFKNINTFPKEFEKYFNDNFAMRNQLLTLNNYIKVKTLQISPNPLVVLGKNDWLFYTGDNAPESMDDYRGIVRFTDSELNTIKSNLETRKKWLNQKGITYLLCIAPNKQTIYPEYLPNNIRKINDETRMDQLINYLKKNSNIDVLDLRKTLFENKSGDMLYYKTDTHWNEYGAYYGYQEIMKSLNSIYPNLKPIPISSFTIDKSFGLGGDISNMLGMKSEYVDSYIHLQPKFNTHVTDLKVDNNMYPNPEQLVTKQINDEKLPKLIMFRDSFSTSMIPLLSLHFNKSIYIWDHKFNGNIIEREKPNIVIDETVERLLPTLLLPNSIEVK
ncbi:DHHW family protein [Paenibacillus sp. WC2504]|uniref:DHHW family protein n=1 Tax=Paenibacillus sp. WC2504 TaxID=3461403 RepID=UPI00404531B0